MGTTEPLNGPRGDVSDNLSSSAEASSLFLPEFHQLQGYVGIPLKPATPQNIFNLYFLFDGAVLPDDPDIELAELSLEARANGLGDLTVDVFELDPDGLWDRRLGEGTLRSSTEFFGSETADLHNFTVSMKVGGTGTTRTVNAQDDVSSPTSIGFVDFRRYAPYAGNAIGPAHEFAEYFRVAWSGSDDLHVQKIGFTIGEEDDGDPFKPEGQMWCELYTAVAGGGGQHNLKPGTLVTNGVSFKYDCNLVNGAGAFEYPGATGIRPIIASQGDYVAVVKADNPIDGIHYNKMSMMSGVDGINSNSGDLGMALRLGQDHGIAPDNYVDHQRVVDQLVASATTPVEWDIGVSLSGVQYTSPDLTTLVQAAANRAQWNDHKIFGLMLSPVAATTNENNFLPYLVGHGHSGTNVPVLNVTYASGRTRTITSL